MNTPKRLPPNFAKKLLDEYDARLAPGVTDIRMSAVYRQFEAARPVDKPGYKAAKSHPCERCGDK